MTAPHYHAHVDDPVAVGRRLKEARLAAGLSQRSLSLPGCSSAYISRLEAGDRVPSLQLLRKLAQKLGVDEEYLARGVERVDEGPPELVEAEVARRLGDFELARERYQAVLEATSAPAAREEAAGQLAQLRGETLAEEDRRELVPGGLDDPGDRARVLWRHSRTLLDRGDRKGAARYARDALALLDYAEDRELAGTREREFARA
ncbi:MAG: helix-turn-helix domain-containing protein [Actinobacteria bacterium]|nr:helix-turn-helix domain-containing protein [Actinomycetota bacterium]